MKERKRNWLREEKKRRNRLLLPLGIILLLVGLSTVLFTWEGITGASIGLPAENCITTCEDITSIICENITSETCVDKSVESCTESCTELCVEEIVQNCTTGSSGNLGLPVEEICVSETIVSCSSSCEPVCVDETIQECTSETKEECSTDSEEVCKEVCGEDNESLQDIGENSSGEEVTTQGWIGIQRSGADDRGDPCSEECACNCTVDESLTLTADLSCDKTALFIDANDIIVDCAGYQVNYSVNGSLGDGINNEGFNNTTIKNCNIFEGNSTTNSKYGIYIDGSENGSIENNNITTSGGFSYGIYLNDGLNITIKDSNITTLGYVGNAIYHYNSPHSKIINNSIDTNATLGRGIFIRSDNVTITENVINTNGSTGYGIHVEGSSNLSINNNTISTAGTDAWGIHLEYIDRVTEANVIINNNLSAQQADEIYDITGDSYINYLIYNNSFGEILWTNESDGGFLKNLTVAGPIALGENLFIGNNTIALNTSAFGSNAFINSSANITIIGLNYSTIKGIKRLETYNVSSSEIIDNGKNCNGTTCFTISYTSGTGTLLFNTSEFSSFSSYENIAPTQGTPTINSTLGTNLTTENLTVYNVSTLDNDSDSIKNIFDWRLNGSSIAVLNMPFEKVDDSVLNATKDYSIFGNDGDEAGGVTWNATGGYDGKGAFEFDGEDDFITCGNDGSLSPVTRSITFWAKPIGGGGMVHGMIVSRATNYYLSFWDVGNLNRIYMSWSNSSSGAKLKFVENGVIPDAWHHYAAVTIVSGNTVNHTFYRDGSRIDSYQDEEGHLPITAELIIGTWTTNYYNGTIDELMIFNRSLSADQVYALYINRTDLLSSDETSSNDNWSACITPNDGTSDGAEACSENLTIENTPPETSSASVNTTSINNYTRDNVTCYATFADNDSDSVYANVSWYNDSEFVYTTQTGTYTVGSEVNVANLTSDNTTKGQNWSCMINAYDGTDNATVWVDSGNVTIENTPPETSSVSVNTTSVNNYTTDNVTCYAQFADNDSDSIYANFTWYLNGTVNETGQSTTTFSVGSLVNIANLSSGNTSIDDNWSCQVQAYDSTDYEGRWTESSNLTILTANNAPSTTSVSVNTTSINNYTTDNVTCYAAATDADADDVYFNFTWYNNSEEHRSGQSGPFTQSIEVNVANLTSDNTTKGQNWSCSVNAYDGTDNETSWTESNNVTIENTAPDQGIPNINSTLGTNTSSENITVYNVSTLDNDSDSVKNIFDWRLNGSSIAILNMPFEKVNDPVINATKDYSGWDNNGSEINGPVWNASGGYDGKGAFEFDGQNQTIELSTSAGGSFDIDEITIAARVYIDGSTGTLQRIFHRTSGAWGLYVESAADQIAFWVDTRDAGGEWKGIATLASSVTTKTWYHVVATFDGTNQIIYLDGEYETAASNTGSIVDNGGSSAYIGAAEGPSQTFNGTIDDVLIFNRSLTPEQVLNLYNNRTDLLSWNETSKNDNWSACITPNDGTEDGTEACSENLTILNTPPETTQVTLNAITLNNYTTDDLTCYAIFADNDSDQIYANYTWYKDSVSNLSGQSSSTFSVGSLVNVANLSSGNTTAGEKWSCQVQAYDSTAYEGRWTESSNITILAVPAEEDPGGTSPSPETPPAPPAPPPVAPPEAPEAPTTVPTIGPSYPSPGSTKNYLTVKEIDGEKIKAVTEINKTNITFVLTNTGDLDMVLVPEVEDLDHDFLVHRKTLNYKDSWASRMSGIWYSSNDVFGTLLRLKIKKEQIVLKPGETKKIELDVEHPKLLVGSKKVKVVLKSFGEVILEEDIIIEKESISLAALDLVPGENFIDIYASISPGEKERNNEEGGLLTGSIVLDKKVKNSDEYLFELNMNKKRLPKNKEILPMKFTLGKKIAELLGGDMTSFGDIYGPYLIQENESFIFAQQLKYDPQKYYGEYLISTKILRGNEIIVENVFDVNLGEEPEIISSGERSPLVGGAIEGLKEKGKEGISFLGLWLVPVIVFLILSGFIICLLIFEAIEEKEVKFRKI